MNAGPDLPKRGIVLATVKHAARRLRRWPAAMLDRGCARRLAKHQAGTKKRPASTEQRNMLGSVRSARGSVPRVVRGSVLDVAGQLIPTARITGIESPEILAADAPNYFAAAWAARAAMEAVLHHPLPREDVGLAVNSPHARSQEQLHIHIDCLRADVVAALHADEAAIGPAWAPLQAPLAGHNYRARFLSEAALGASNPFKLLEADVGAAAMAQQTLVVAGAVSSDGRPGFVLLADHFDPVTGDRAAGEALQDHDCAVIHPGTPG